MLWSAQHRFNWAMFDDFTPIHHEQSISKVKSLSKSVCDKQDRYLVFSPEISEQIQDRYP